MFHGLSLNGFSLVTSMWCSVTSVCPISPSSRANTLWNLLRRSFAFSLLLGIHESSPPKSSSPSSLYRYSWMVITFLSSASGLSTTIVSGIFAATIQVMGVLFSIHMGMSFMLYNSTETRWLPMLYSVDRLDVGSPRERRAILSKQFCHRIHFGPTKNLLHASFYNCVGVRGKIFHLGCMYDLLVGQKVWNTLVGEAHMAFELQLFFIIKGMTP